MQPNRLVSTNRLQPILPLTNPVTPSLEFLFPLHLRHRLKRAFPSITRRHTNRPRIDTSPHTVIPHEHPRHPEHAFTRPGAPHLRLSSHAIAQLHALPEMHAARPRARPQVGHAVLPGQPFPARAVYQAARRVCAASRPGLRAPIPILHGVLACTGLCETVYERVQGEERDDEQSHFHVVGSRFLDDTLVSRC